MTKRNDGRARWPGLPAGRKPVCLRVVGQCEANKHQNLAKVATRRSLVIPVL